MTTTISSLLNNPALANTFSISVMQLLRNTYDTSAEKAEIKWINQLYESTLVVQVVEKKSTSTNPIPSFSSTNFNKMCYEFLADVEGVQLSSYPDPPGRSIGIGHHIIAGEVFKEPLTQQEVVALFFKDLPHYQNPVDTSIKIPLPSKSRVALVSLVYNVGHMPNQLAKLINTKQFAKAAKFWLSDPEVKPFLVERRKKEIRLFLDALGVSINV
jgi:GH24 family phage-related lysozyme (muramidase)